MTIKKKICSAFCEGLSVRSVPLGYAIKTPFSWLHGEPLVVFGEVSNGMVRMRDSGDTLSLLEDIAGDLTTDTRMDAMRQLASDHGVRFDENNSLFTSDWVHEDNLGNIAIRFMSFLNRIQDLSFLTREKVTSAFREELTEAIRERFQGRYYVGVREQISPQHREYTADIIIRNAQMQAAIYAATSEVNALEALLTEHVFANDPVRKTVPIIIFEDFLGSKLTTKTKHRVMNSSRLEMADWAGGKDDVMDKIEKIVEYSIN